MLRRGALYLLILALALLASPTVTPPVAAAGTTYVVDDDIHNCVNGLLPDFAAISTAVAAATDGDTIRVCEGEYTLSTLIIDRSVTITGPGATPENDGVATVRHGSGGGTAMFDINANGITIEGLDLDLTPPPGFPFTTGGFLGSGDYLTIRDNEIHDATVWAVAVGTVPHSSHVSILRNNIHDNVEGVICQVCDDSGFWSNTVDAGDGIAFYLRGARSTIGGNVVTNGLVIAAGSDLLVQNNQLSAGGADSALYVSGNPVTVTDNSLSDAAATGIRVESGGASDTSAIINGNTFTQVNTPIELFDSNPSDAFGLTATIGGSSAEANTFVDSGGSLGDMSYLVEMEGPTANVNAEYNKWGLCTAAEIEQEIYHQVDDPAQGLVDFEPFIAPDGCAAPTPTPTATATPPVGPTRTVQWDPGWHSEMWTGSSTPPEQAFACAQGKYAAAYRLVSGGWERYFPDRPDISNMGPLEQYDAFLILVIDNVTCQMPVADPPAAERLLEWDVGWQNRGWTGPDAIPPQDALACAAGSYAATYRLVAGSWERHFPDRPDISNMGPLNRYDAFLILVTAPVSCTMPIAS
jgi:hypothetical protein